MNTHTHAHTHTHTHTHTQTHTHTHTHTHINTHINTHTHKDPLADRFFCYSTSNSAQEDMPNLTRLMNYISKDILSKNNQFSVKNHLILVKFYQFFH